jgi:hypothetical protein
LGLECFPFDLSVLIGFAPKLLMVEGSELNATTPA